MHISSDEKLQNGARWISPQNRMEGSRIRLFCLPHAGSGTAAYNRWKRMLPPFVEICPILLPGRESRFAEAPLTSSAVLHHEMLDTMVEWVDKPYAIFGHSMGALLAFELAQRIRERGLPEPSQLFLSGRIAVHLPLPGRPIHKLPEEEFLAELARRYDGLPRELLADRDMLEIYLPILRADFTLLETYEFRRRKPMDCPITVFAGTEDRSVNLEALMLWREHTSSEFEAHRLPGGHFYLAGESRAGLLSLLRERLVALDRASALQST